MCHLIEVGYSPCFKLVINKVVELPFSAWTLDNKDLAILSAKCLNYFSKH